MEIVSNILRAKPVLAHWEGVGEEGMGHMMGWTGMMSGGWGLFAGVFFFAFWVLVLVLLALAVVWLWKKVKKE